MQMDSLAGFCSFATVFFWSRASFFIYEIVSAIAQHQGSSEGSDDG